MIARHLVIRGCVQGVGFRYCMEIVANRIGVYGWVRNRVDGTVEAHVEASVEMMTQIVDWTRTGPPGARVLGVDVAEVPVEGLRAFSRLPTV